VEGTAVLAFSDILDFLLHLLGDDEARAEFERDPNGTLDRAGLEGVTAQDIRDARLQLADSGAVSATDHSSDHHGAPYHGDDPVHEIGYTARHYAADEHGAHHDAPPVDHSSNTFLTIDDRDTLFFQSISDDDVTVTDNSVAISGSFNQDNSDDDVTAIQDNDNIQAIDSFNEDNDVTAVQDNDVAVDIDTTPAEAPDPEPAVDTADPADVVDTTPEPPADEVDEADPVDAVDDADVEDDPADLEDDTADDPAADAAPAV
jgi:hypothetical protein